MITLVSANCTLQTGLPQVEQECRTRIQEHLTHLNVMTDTHIQAHRQDMDRVREQLVTQVASDQAQLRVRQEQEHALLAQTQQGMATLANHVTTATQHLQEATSQWKSSMSVGTRKGAMGEREVMEALQVHFGTMSVVHTGSTPGSGDIHLLHTDQDSSLGDVLVEVKCYMDATGYSATSSTSSTASTASSRVVPSHEVVKFEHDVDRCQMPLAVMGALGTGIRTKGSMQLDQRGNTLVLYMPNATPGGMVTGILALQMIHKWRATTRCGGVRTDTISSSETHPATSPTGTDTTIHAYNQLLQQLGPLMQDIEQELEHNTFFVDVHKELTELDSLRRRMKGRVEEHKMRLADVSRRARRMLQEELQDAAQLVLDSDTHESAATTPDGRRTLMDQAMAEHNQSDTTRQKHLLAVGMFLDWLHTRDLGLCKSHGGLLVLTKTNEPCAFVDVKKTKVALRDPHKTWSLNLANEGVERLTAALECLL